MLCEARQVDWRQPHLLDVHGDTVHIVSNVGIGEDFRYRSGLLIALKRFIMFKEGPL